MAIPLRRPPAGHRLFGFLAVAVCWSLSLESAQAPLGPGDALPIARVTVRFELVEASALPAFGGVLTIEPYRAHGLPESSDPSRKIIFSSADPLTLALKTGRPWNFKAAGPGWWAAGEILNLRASETAREVTLAIWPTGSVSGQLQMAERRDLWPREIEAHMETSQPRGSGTRSPWGKVLCPVTEKGSFLCDLPGTVLDLSFRAEGFVPHYRWRTSVVAQKSASLGTVVLQRGASLMGFVEARQGALLPERCRLRLVPAVPVGGDPQGVSLQMERSAPTAYPDSRGFFQFRGLARGQYLLRAEHPGFAPAEVGPIAIEIGLESRLREPLELSPPISLALSIDPPLDWLGRPWQVHVRRASPFAASAPPVADFHGRAPDDGHLVVPGRVAGPYRLSILDSVGNRFFADDTPATLEPDQAERHVQIDLVALHGSLFRGKEPLPATLWFGGSFGHQRVRFEADEDGVFEGFLPRAGTWTVDIEPAEGDPVGPRSVEVRADRQGRASVVLRLPDTRLFGRVVSATDQRPVGGAAVLIDSDTAPREVRTAPDGSFSIRGLEAGPVALTAQRKAAGQAWYSDQARVVVVDGAESGPVLLTLRPARTLSGQVSFQGLAVAGASLSVQSREPRAEAIANSVTGPDGRFEVRVPSDVSGHRVHVRAQGFPVQSFDVAADAGEARLDLREEQGELIVLCPGSAPRAATVGRVLLWQGGIEVPPELLRTQPGQPLWVDRPAGGRELKLPSAAAGEYRACWLDANQAGDLAAGSCAAGQLLPGASLVLDLIGH